MSRVRGGAAGRVRAGKPMPVSRANTMPVVSSSRSVSRQPSQGSIHSSRLSQNSIPLSSSSTQRSRRSSLPSADGSSPVPNIGSARSTTAASGSTHNSVVPSPLDMYKASLEAATGGSRDLTSTYSARSHGSHASRSSAASSASRPSSRSSSIHETSSPFRVVVRIRPPSEKERMSGDQVIVDSGPDGRSVTVSAGQHAPPGMPVDGRAFPADHVLTPGSTQSSMFSESGVTDLIDASLNGYSTCILAFGQTGSGKTYTMSGRDEAAVLQPGRFMGAPTPLATSISSGEAAGVVPRAIAYLFDKVAAEPERRWRIRASYVEIWNEQVRDLLNTEAGSLAVRWNSRQGFYVENLFVVDCDSVDDLVAVNEEGVKNRRVAAHDMNSDSSRSHSLLTVYLDEEVVDEDDGHTLVRYGKVSFVDLAGSERVKESNSAGDTLTETRNINKSLLSLGKVISMLGDSKRRTGHIPYRDSKLTKLLMDSLSGAGYTLMICCCSPAASNAEETIKTLRYAQQASNIKTAPPSINMDPHEQLVASLRAEVRLLRSENSLLRDQYGVGSGSMVSTPTMSARSSFSATFPEPAAPKPKPQSRQERSEGDAKLLQEAMTLNQRLESENAAAHAARDMMEKQFKSVMSENERLRVKLERLETIFQEANDANLAEGRGDRKPIDKLNATS